MPAYKSKLKPLGDSPDAAYASNVQKANQQLAVVRARIEKNLKK